MGYKYKPSKSVAKRFKVTKTGKVKGHHGLHLSPDEQPAGQQATQAPQAAAFA